MKKAKDISSIELKGIVHFAVSLGNWKEVRDQINKLKR